jgi:hypothetical protein
VCFYKNLHSSVKVFVLPPAGVHNSDVLLVIMSVLST